MNPLNIQQPLTDAQMTEIMDSFGDIWHILVFLQIISIDDIKKLRKLGLKLDGYVETIDTTVVAFPNVVPVTRPYAKFAINRKAKDQLTLITNKSGELFQALTCTQMLLGNEIITTADEYYNAIKRAAKNDIALAEPCDKLTKMLAKKDRAKPKVFTIAAGGSLLIESVVTDTELVNKGQAVISFNAAPGLGSKSKEDALTVDPMSSKTIPSGWVKIVITNLSATQDATVAVRTK